MSESKKVDVIYYQEKKQRTRRILYERSLRLRENIGMFDIKVWDDIVKCCNNEDLKEVVDNRLRLFYPINTKDAANKIIQIGSLLEIAYTGSKCHGSNIAHVIEVSTRYQEVVKSTLNACTTSTNIAIEALYFHRHAILFAEKGKVRKAITFLGQCADLASKMRDECDKMITEIEELLNSSRKAFTTSAESYLTDAGEQPLAQRVNQFNVHLENLRQKAIDLEEEVEKATIWAEQNKEVKKSLKDRLTFGLFGPISYIGDTEIKSTNLKIALQMEGRELNDDLVRSVGGFKETEYAQNELVTSATCFEIFVKVLEKVKRIFVHGKRFWSAVEYSSKLLPSSADRLSDEDVFSVCKDAFLTEIKASGVGWLAIGNMCRQAALDTRDVIHGMNRSRPKLLNAEIGECRKLIEKLSTTLLSEVAEESERTDDVTSNCLYEILLAKIETINPDDAQEVFDTALDDAQDVSDIPLENGLETPE